MYWCYSLDIRMFFMFRNPNWFASFALIRFEAKQINYLLRLHILLQNTRFKAKREYYSLLLKYPRVSNSTHTQKFHRNFLLPYVLSYFPRARKDEYNGILGIWSTVLHMYTEFRISLLLWNVGCYPTLAKNWQIYEKLTVFPKAVLI
jgi:hypothetical protein